MSKYSKHSNERKGNLKLIDEWMNGRPRFKDNHIALRHLFEYTDEQVEFMKAMYEFKKRLGRMPTYPEILAEARRIGYRKPEAGT